MKLWVGALSKDCTRVLDVRRGSYVYLCELQSAWLNGDFACQKGTSNVIRSDRQPSANGIVMHNGLLRA